MQDPTIGFVSSRQPTHTLDELSDLEELRRLKPLYWRYVDSKQWERLRALFTDDARFEGTVSESTGPDEWIAALATSFRDMRSVHRGHTPELAIVGEGVARGVWPFSDYLDWSACDPAEVSPNLQQFPGQWGIVGFGHYEEEYRRGPEGWRISFMRLTRQRMDALSGKPSGRVEIDRELSRDWIADGE